MFEETWQYRKTEGLGGTVDGFLVVGNETIHLRPGLRRFLPWGTAGSHTAHRSDWQQSNLSAGLLVTFGLGGAMLVLGIYQAPDQGIVGTGTANLLGAVSTFLTVWDTYFRETTIPLSSVERVSVNERELTVRYEHDSQLARMLGWLTDWNTGTKTLELPAEGAVQEAGRTLRRRGVTVEDETEVVDTTHRFVVEDGAYFCASCKRQVSPADEQCPSCGFPLRKREEQTVSSSPEMASTSP